MKKYLVAATMVFASAPMFAQEAATPIQIANGAALMASSMCTLTQDQNERNALYRRSGMAVSDKTCSELQSHISEAYDKVKPHAKTRGQREALDNWRVEWMAAMRNADNGMPAAVAMKDAEKASERLRMVMGKSK